MAKSNALQSEIRDQVVAKLTVRELQPLRRYWTRDQNRLGPEATPGLDALIVLRKLGTGLTLPCQLAWQVCKIDKLASRVGCENLGPCRLARQVKKIEQDSLLHLIHLPANGQGS